MPQFGASLTVISYAPRVISRAPNIFIIEFFSLKIDKNFIFGSESKIVAEGNYKNGA
jgi:hypothetical protein